MLSSLGSMLIVSWKNINVYVNVIFIDWDKDNDYGEN